jgi:hypothetical protein
MLTVFIFERTVFRWRPVNEILKQYNSTAKSLDGAVPEDARHIYVNGQGGQQGVRH